MIKELTLRNLSLGEFYSLESDLGSANVKKSDYKNWGERHGALELIAASIIVTALSLRALSIWLAKNKQTVTLETSESTRLPDGSERTVKSSATIKCDTSEAAVLKQLATFMKLPKLPVEE